MSNNHGRNLAIDNDADESAIIKVSGGSDAQAVASAISNAFYDSSEVTMRAVGAAAVNQAAKAIAIARGYIAPRGVDLVTRIGWINVANRDGSGSISALVFRLELM